MGVGVGVGANMKVAHIYARVRLSMLFYGICICLLFNLSAALK